MSSYNSLGIYIHIPFCKSKCEYCDFYSIPGPCKKRMVNDYVQALAEHMKETSPYAESYEVDTVYFGGGTPSFFGDDGLRRILGELDKWFVIRKDAEITLEANPDSVNYKSLDRLRRSGFNRISIGVQSSSDTQLKALGRPHNYRMAKEAVASAREAGFNNLSVDLMYGLPNQSPDQWAGSLQDIIQLRPDHISAYGLTVEPNTPLAKYSDCINLPDADMQADMYLYAVDTLESFGYPQYEISNFAKPGRESVHNLKYWLGGEYIGFGPAAASDFGGRRYTAVRDLSKYIDGIFNNKAILAECDSVPIRERAGEYLMLRLRTVYGIEKEEYEQRYKMDFAPLEALLQRLQSQGFARPVKERWRLTPSGFLLSNQIIGLLQDAQRESSASWMDHDELDRL